MQADRRLSLLPGGSEAHGTRVRGRSDPDRRDRSAGEDEPLLLLVVVERWLLFE